MTKLLNDYEYFLRSILRNHIMQERPGTCQDMIARWQNIHTLTVAFHQKATVRINELMNDPTLPTDKELFKMSACAITKAVLNTFIRDGFPSFYTAANK